MNKSALNLRVLAIFTGLLVVSSLCYAQATRTWVSGVGDDANPCSRTAPCKTFAGAISKTAPGGEINVLDPGGFGAVTITKPITISSEGFEAGVLVSGTNGIIINVPNATDVVVIRGLDIQGLGTGLSGISVLTGGTVYVEKCTIDRFTTAGITFTPTVTNSQLIVTDSIVRNNSGGGINVKSSTSAIATKISIDGSRLEGNLFGFKQDGGSKGSISKSLVAGNTNAGVSSVTILNGGTSLLMVDHTQSVNNGSVGFQANGSATAEIFITEVTTFGNTSGGLLQVAGGIIKSFGTNSIQDGGAPNLPNLPLQ